MSPPSSRSAFSRPASSPSPTCSAREYRLPSFFTFKPHGRRTIQLWNVTLICLLMLGFLAQISVDYSRGWIVLFYVATLAALIVLRFVMVRVSALARAAGLLSAQRIFLIGTGAHVGGFVNRYEPWMLGINIVGCRFLTPVAATASAEMRRATLDRDLAEAVASVRGLEPDAIFCWCRGRRPKPSSAAPRLFSRCRSRFISVPSRSCTNSRRSSSPGSARWRACSSRAVPLSRLEIIQKRLFDLVLGGVGLVLATPLLVARRHPDQARQSGTDFLRAAPLRLQSAAVPHHQVSHHAHARRRRGDSAGAAAAIRD